MDRKFVCTDNGGQNIIYLITIFDRYSQKAVSEEKMGHQCVPAPSFEIFSNVF